MFKALMRSTKVHVPKWDLPIRFRLWFIVLTAFVMLILAFLGFSNFSRSLPLNDKALHFLCFTVATAVFYFIFDVEEDARRIWIWRYAGLLTTAFTCFFVGGILSEFVQSMLPYKQFQAGDVVANLAGSSLGLYLAFHLERYYRRRREISRLYRPIDATSTESDDSDDDLAETLLPSHYLPSSSSRPVAHAHSGSTSNAKHVRKNSVNVSNVWDEREELFGIGEEDEFDDDDEGMLVPTGPGTPTIKITPSSA